MQKTEKVTSLSDIQNKFPASSPTPKKKYDKPSKDND